MTNPLNDHPTTTLIDPVDDAVVTSSGAEEPFQLISKWSTDLPRRLGERTVDELEWRDSHLLGNRGIVRFGGPVHSIEYV